MNTEKENTLPEQAEEEICEVEKSIPETEKDTDAEGGDASAFGESPSPPDREAEEMAALIETLEERNRELTAALASARADFFNYRKRVERDRQRERTVAGEEKAMEFIPVLDNLDRALAVKSGSDGKTVLEGVTMVRRQFLSVLESMGVEPVPTVGYPFSPEFHDAVAAEETDDPEKNGIVIEEIQTGYRTKERTLRPAKVKVASCTIGKTQ